MVLSASFRTRLIQVCFLDTGEACRRGSQNDCLAVCGSGGCIEKSNKCKSTKLFHRDELLTKLGKVMKHQLNNDGS